MITISFNLGFLLPILIFKLYRFFLHFLYQNLLINLVLFCIYLKFPVFIYTH